MNIKKNISTKIGIIAVLAAFSGFSTSAFAVCDDSVRTTAITKTQALAKRLRCENDGTDAFPGYWTGLTIWQYQKGKKPPGEGCVVHEKLVTSLDAPAKEKKNPKSGRNDQPGRGAARALFDYQFTTAAAKLNEFLYNAMDVAVENSNNVESGNQLWQVAYDVMDIQDYVSDLISDCPSN